MIRAVIGAGYGDEGKGLLTDYFSDHLTLVVRYNGGAQAGHTVVLPDGRRHEFHHLGAGCFQAACTLLSRFFVVNPLLFRREFEAPALQGIRRTVFVDPRARVTLPFDMMLNCAAEDARGDGRHGSCGVGINETIERHDAGLEFVVDDLDDLDRLREDILDVRRRYVPRRAQALGVAVPAACDLVGLVDRFIDDCRFFRAHVIVSDDAALIAGAGDVVFEGAQGLRLDERAPGFPHVTRSRTGLPNILTLLDLAGRGAEPLDLRYVTRCYVTRHGAGPLSGEVDGHPFGWTGPETNVGNAYQGRLRYGTLDWKKLGGPILSDLRHAIDRPGVDPSLVVTCLDQAAGRLAGFTVGDAVALAGACGLPLSATSHGPTRDDVRALKEVTGERRRLVSGDEAVPATRQHTSPCGDCPWSRAALPGWTGSLTPADWLRSAHGEDRIECHTLSGAQCAGAATYRANVCKVTRDPTDLRLPADRGRVFATPTEFRNHHEGSD